MVKPQILKTVPVFSGLSKTQIRQLAEISKLREYGENGIILSEKSHSGALCFVISGSVKIYKTTKTGHIKILSYLNKGDIFGEMSIFTADSRSATAAAAEECKVLVIASDAFKKVAAKNVDILIKIIVTLSRRLKKADEEIKSLAYNTVLARTVFVLLDFMKEHGVRKNKKIIIDFPLTQAEIARNVGSAREVVSRMLAKLEKLKYIESHRGKIAILNQKGLKKIIY